MKCPFCGSEKIIIWSSKRKIFKCKDCGKHFTEETNINRGVIIENKRYCLKCGDLKDFSLFFNKKGKPRSICKECTKLLENQYRFSSKGIDRTTFLLMIHEQQNKCKICDNDLKSSSTSYIDHNHKTGEARGILCPSCNTLLGLCNDDINILQNAIEYLKRQQSPLFEKCGDCLKIKSP